jgi:NMD protein affecting ribosome stability and mRNA decay
MSDRDYFKCPCCGLPSEKSSNPRAREQGVCSDCWWDFYQQRDSIPGTPTVKTVSQR